MGAGRWGRPVVDPAPPPSSARALAEARRRGNPGIARWAVGHWHRLEPGRYRFVLDRTVWGWSLGPGPGGVAVLSREGEVLVAEPLVAPTWVEARVPPGRVRAEVAPAHHDSHLLRRTGQARRVGAPTAKRQRVEPTGSFDRVDRVPLALRWSVPDRHSSTRKTPTPPGTSV